MFVEDEKRNVVVAHGAKSISFRFQKKKREKSKRKGAPVHEALMMHLEDEKKSRAKIGNIIEHSIGMRLTRLALLF